MNEYGLTVENLLRALPPALAADETMRALAEAVARQLTARPQEIQETLIYPQIDQLDGPLLDILARDFKVDWWDSDYTVEEKRRTLEGSWQVHRTLGTKAAVERAISAVYPNTQVQEWFEYGGEPYHFRLEIDITHDTKSKEKQARALARMNYYKNLRSHLESFTYVNRFEPVILENSQAFFFLHALIRWRVKRDIESRLAALSMRGALAYRGECEQGFTVGYGKREKSAVLLSGAVIRLHGNNNLRIVNYALDGRRRLDGSWILGDIENPGIAFRVFRARWQKQVGEALTARLCLGAGARSPAGISAGFQMQNSIQNRPKAEVKNLKFHVSVGEKMTLSACEIRDTMWRLDSGVTLDGARKLNAKIERREL